MAKKAKADGPIFFMAANDPPSEKWPVVIELEMEGFGFEQKVRGTIKTASGVAAMAALIREIDTTHESWSQQ